MSRSFFLAGILGVIAVSVAHASGLALKKVDSLSRRAAVILPGSLLKAQSFRLPAELGTAPAPKADTKAVPVGMKPKFERKERIQTRIAVVQPVLGPYLRNNQSWQQATAHFTEARRKELQDDVNAKCKVVSRACKGDQECEILRQNLAKNQACYDARKKIVDECFGGKPSPGHQQELNEAQNAINTCITWIGKICGVGIRSEAR
ncbi:MAG: hypothetical protein KGL74_00970 [Elusimicrobia bacterium]|nr:hypothetical protein [Elusimicrobiota bacterium]